MTEVTNEQALQQKQMLDVINKRLDGVIERYDERIMALARRVERVRDDEQDRWRDFRRAREEEQQRWLAIGIKAAVVVAVLLLGIAIGAASESANQPEPAKVEALK